MEKSLVIALHGFLGLPSDWNQWHQTHAPDKELFAIDLWKHPELNSSMSLKEWTQSFIELSQKKIQEGYTLELWGYSMGGRLALGALVKAPQLFSKALILSANPGLESDNERQTRFLRDSLWAEKFSHSEWSQVIHEWHSQPVLQEPPSVDNPVNRMESQFERQRLAQALTNWSIAQQPNYWPSLSTLVMPVEWHAGSYDKTYCQIADRVKSLLPQIKVKIHANRGHRLIV